MSRAGWRARGGAQALVGAALAGALVSLALPRPGLIDGLAEDAALALAARLFAAPRPPAQARAVVIALDARSLADPDLAGLPRALMSPVWAQAAQRALDAGAAAVGFDLILAFDASKLTIDGAAPLRRWDDAFLRLQRAQAGAGRVVIAAARDAQPAARFARIAGPAGVGLADLPVDPDGVVRRAAPALPDATGGAQPSLGGRLIAAAGLADPPADLALSRPRPLDALPTASLIDVLRCDDPAALSALFGGRVALVGSVLAGEDRHRAPDRFMPRIPPDREGDPCAFARPQTRDATPGAVAGVFLHASAVDAALSGDAPAETGRPAAALAAAGGAVAGAALALTAPAWAAAGGALALGAASMLGAAALIDAGWLVPAARAPIGLALGLLTAWAVSAGLLDRRARRLRTAFSRYLAPSLVDRMIEQDSPPRLEGEQRRVAVMFADLSGFTALSERTAPDVLTAAVNRYLGVIARGVEAEGGYVDKFIGDAAMALWNAPLDHPAPELAAARAGLRIADAVAAEAALDRIAGRPAFAVKVAVAAGPAAVGNVGHERRMNYTALGPTVNLAARLESQPGRFGVAVVLDEVAAAAVADAVAMLEIARIPLKGVGAPARIFAAFAMRGERPALEAALAAHAPAYAAALAADGPGAAAQWRALAALDWPGARPAAVQLAGG